MNTSSVSGMIFGSKERLWRVRSVYQANVHLWFGVLTTVAVLNLIAALDVSKGTEVACTEVSHPEIPKTDQPELS